MSDLLKALVEDIDAFLKRTKMSATYFGKRAANNSEVVKRLKAGKTITVETVEKLEKFMAERPPATIKAAGDSPNAPG